MARKKRSKKAKSTPQKPTDELLRRLEDISRQLDLIQDVLLVCSTAVASRLDLQEELNNVLRRHVSNPLFDQRKHLHEIIVSLGGSTSMSRDNDDYN